MNRGTQRLVFLAALPRKIFNRLLNVIASRLESGRIDIDWTDARILNPARVIFEGSIRAGRGLWLQPVVAASTIRIGDGARFSDAVHIGALGNIVIGRNALIGSKVVIIDHSHGHATRALASESHMAPGDRELVSNGDIVIGDNVWLGDNVVVLGGARIGDGCIVGANALVRGELPPGTVCVGNPARALPPKSDDVPSPRSAT
jgi:acetyltransferase-like isoleucine patch superfamily enzyme